ncbi:MAG TPA: hypothetical protein VF157_00365 [Chloroflexota bacterium]
MGLGTNGGAAVGMGVSVAVGLGVPEARAVGDCEMVDACPASAVAVAFSARSSSSMDRLVLGLADGRGVELAAAAGLAEAAAAGLAAVTGVTCWTSAGGPAEKAGADAAGWSAPPTGGTGVDGRGVKVGVGVLPLRVELTICRAGAAVGLGVGRGAAEPNAPLTASSVPPIAAATATASTGKPNRRQPAAGFWSVTRQARGLAVRR